MARYKIQGVYRIIGTGANLFLNNKVIVLIGY